MTQKLLVLAQQEQTLLEEYQFMAEEHTYLAEVSVCYVVQVLDPDEYWPEYQDE